MKHITDRQLSAFIDDDLSAAEREFVDTHCEACAACAQRRTDYLQVQRMVKGLPHLEVQEDYALTRIRAHIASNEAHKEARSRGWQLWHSLAALGTTALIAFALIFTLTYGDEQSLFAPGDICIVEQETDDIIRGYQDMRQLYYF